MPPYTISPSHPDFNVAWRAGGWEGCFEASECLIVCASMMGPFLRVQSGPSRELRSCVRSRVGAVRERLSFLFAPFPSFFYFLSFW